MKSILLVAGIGLDAPSHVGGELTKNRVFLSYMKKKIGNEYILTVVDTHKWNRKPVRVIGRILFEYIFGKNDHVLISVATRSALKLLKIFDSLWWIRKAKITYLVIGGTLPAKLEQNPKMKDSLRKCLLICPETKDIVRYLNKLGLSNTLHVPNFKEFSFVPTAKSTKRSCLRIVFFSRINKEKGIELAVKAVKQLSGTYNIDLDIFGPVDPGYKMEFAELMRSAENIHYKGVLKPDTNETYEILAKYDLMVFPTSHEGEGFPGSLIDAYIAGLPVLASDWKYNSEIVKEGTTGWLAKPKDLRDFSRKFEFILQHKEQLVSMRAKCLEEAQRYHVGNVLPKMLKDMGIKVSG